LEEASGEIAVITLALVIGAMSSIFSIGIALLLKPFKNLEPFSQAEKEYNKESRTNVWVTF